MTAHLHTFKGTPTGLKGPLTAVRHDTGGEPRRGRSQQSCLLDCVLLYFCVTNACMHVVNGIHRYETDCKWPLPFPQAATDRSTTFSGDPVDVICPTPISHFSCQQSINSIHLPGRRLPFAGPYPHSHMPQNAASVDAQGQEHPDAARRLPCTLFAITQYECTATDTIKCWPLERIFRQ